MSVSDDIDITTYGEAGSVRRYVDSETGRERVEPTKDHSRRTLMFLEGDIDAADHGYKHVGTSGDAHVYIREGAEMPDDMRELFYGKDAG